MDERFRLAKTVVGPGYFGLPTGTKVLVNGIVVEVIEPADGELSDLVVCIPATTPLTRPDNEVGPCAKCAILLQFRPTAPKAPPHVCVECAVAWIEEDAKKAPPAGADGARQE